MIGPFEIMVVNLAIFFGHYIIISTALNFQYGNAGIPNMSSNISVACGAYVVSSIVLKITMCIGSAVGLELKPDWVWDNPYNIHLINSYLESAPLLGFSLFILSIAMALLFGSMLGWGLSLISGKLRGVQLMIIFFVIPEAANLIVANNKFIAGGAQGAFIPNFLTWYQGEQMLIVALVTLLVGLISYFVIRKMLKSPFGRLMKATRENEWTVVSIGKSAIAIRRNVMAFGSGMMAVTGVLLSIYFSFVQYQFYSRVSYTIWPWLMITLGGLGNDAGSFIGVLICVSIIRILSMIHNHLLPLALEMNFVRILSYMEDMVLGSLLILFFILRPNGLIPERSSRISGINYKDIIANEEKNMK
ncbi:branched-chain amino acid ABC transporter permease [Candidatus Bathyarchaeota archaeon]|nr:branched-chain amino acid ABC transporter permease [Candidatus Bathyarchaeota archaeon]MBS7630957.1 branched-chain amino acid ABC transporter permease [Candidatus Bathyarchaeota archaeon]